MNAVLNDAAFTFLPITLSLHLARKIVKIYNINYSMLCNDKTLVHNFFTNKTIFISLIPFKRNSREVFLCQNIKISHLQS